MQFTRVINPVEDMEIWNANGNGFSFAISYENRNGPGFHGRPGFVASWRPIDQNRSATGISGSPFNTLAEAEEACNAMLGLLAKAGPMGGNEAHVNFDAPAVLRKWPSLRTSVVPRAPAPIYLSTAPLMSAYGSSWPSHRLCITCTRYIQRHSHR
jgi:hypothetical protein